MRKKTTQALPPTVKDAKKQRLKSALKANLQRRKAQARARDQAETDRTGTSPASGNNKAG